MGRLLGDGGGSRFLFGPKLDQLLASDTADRGLSFALTDRLGSVRGLMYLPAMMVEQQAFTSFGVALPLEGTSSFFSYSFTGRTYDDEIGIYYYRARYYDARLGRFTSQDPVDRRSAGYQPYRYGDPINTIDPTGKTTITEFIVLTSLIAATSVVAVKYFGKVVEDAILDQVQVISSGAVI